MTNPVRTCIGCQQTDDHPKHQMVLPDWSSVYWHFDCHASADPPCADVCAKQLKGLAKGSIGEDMRAHLIRNRKD